jgi:hypothetical protein
MIVKQEKIKAEAKKRNRRSLPPARIGAAPLCLVGGSAAVEAAHHCWFGMCIVWKEEELRLAKIRELKDLVER